jgi:hypothetical protein
MIPKKLVSSYEALAAYLDEMSLRFNKGKNRFFPRYAHQAHSLREPRIQEPHCESAACRLILKIFNELVYGVCKKRKIINGVAFFSLEKCPARCLLVFHVRSQSGVESG